MLLRVAKLLGFGFTTEPGIRRRLDLIGDFAGLWSGCPLR